MIYAKLFSPHLNNTTACLSCIWLYSSIWRSLVTVLINSRLKTVHVKILVASLPYGNICTPHGHLLRNTVPAVPRPPVCTVTSDEGSDDREHLEQSGVTLESQTRSANNTRLVLPPKKRPYNHWTIELWFVF
jgi:hypothetical protein